MRRYSQVWSLPSAPILLLAGFLGRLPVAMVPLALLLLVESRTGSYATAGLATAAYGLATAAVAPLLGRLADRIGPRPVLLVTGVTYPATLVGLLVILRAGTPDAVILAAAAVAGTAMPLISSTVRALWIRVSGEGPVLQSAYALDAICVECVFVLGPVLVAVFVTFTSPAVPVVLAAVLAVIGSVAVAASAPARAWRPAAGARPRAAGPLRSGGMRVLLASTAVVMFGLGCLEVAVPAYAEDGGLPAMSGVLLAVWALGSAAGGLWFGAQQLRMSLPRQYRWGLLAIAVGFAPLAVATDPWVLGALLFLGGTAIAPTVSVQNALVASMAPARATTEAFTWLTTVVFGASALGAAVAGVLVEQPEGIALALGLATASAFAAAGIASVAGRRLATALA
ncbi:MAG: MFS transporter [Geodermatophilaceae bacterium]|nr:MFS transporter [Geodermatophilaceae bacterium]